MQVTSLTCANSSVTRRATFVVALKARSHRPWPGSQGKQKPFRTALVWRALINYIGCYAGAFIIEFLNSKPAKVIVNSQGTEQYSALNRKNGESLKKFKHEKKARFSWIAGEYVILNGIRLVL